ncbi:hypothetical protein GQX74_014932 [Glossina fuscipes]|nr:hypothetical protein GQX74_014932 [Glossina fuscipes]
MDQLAIPEHRGLEMLPRASRVSHQLRAKAPQPHPLTQTISPKTDTSSRVGLASSSAESSCPNNNNNGRRELVSTEESIVYYQPGLLRNFRLILNCCKSGGNHEAERIILKYFTNFPLTFALIVLFVPFSVLKYFKNGKDLEIPF